MKGEVYFGAAVNDDETEWTPIISVTMREGNGVTKTIQFTADVTCPGPEEINDLTMALYIILTEKKHHSNFELNPDGELRGPTPDRLHRDEEVN